MPTAAPFADRPRYGIPGEAREGGFALIELVGALFVLAMVVAVAVPWGEDLVQAALLERKAAGIAALIRADRNAALAEGRAIYTAVDLRQGQVRSGAGGDRVLLPRFADIQLSRAEDAASATTGGFVFHGDGRSSGGQLVLAGGGRVYTISVNWASSAVTVSKGAV